MGRKRLSGKWKKKLNAKVNSDSQFEEEQVFPAIVQSMKAEESICKNTLKEKTLVQPELPTSQNKSNHIPEDDNISYNCKICHVVFSSQYTLRRHIDYYDNPRFPCKECKTKFPDEKQIESHVINAHRNQHLTWKCQFCNQSFIQERHLHSHQCHYHEDYKVSTKAMDDCKVSNETIHDCKVSTETIVKVESVIARESFELVEDGASCIKDLKKMTPTRHSKRELNLRTDHRAENDTLPNENIENVTCPVFEEPVGNGNKKCDERLESHEAKDNENKCNPILTTNEKKLCWSEERSLLLTPKLEDQREDTVIDGNTGIVFNMKAVFNSPGVIEDRDESLGKVLQNTKIITSASEEYEKLETTPITNVAPGEPIINDITPSITISALSGDQVLVDNVGTDEPITVKLECSSSSLERVETTNFDDIQDSTKRLENNVLLESRLNADMIDAPPADAQENLRDNNAIKSYYEANDYDKETAMRSLYSCKDCYVPLVRVKTPKTSRTIATGDITQSKNEKFNTVFPSVVCDQKFATKSMMFRHYRLMHLTYFNDQVHCVCGKLMNGDEALQFHFYRHCQKTIQSATISANSGAACNPLEQKFACTGCEKKFWLESCLRSHVYDCESFLRQKMTKILTKRAHVPTTVISKHVCAVCCSAFRSEAKLSNHERMYSRIANYRCAFCETMFYGVQQWRCHMATAHNPINKRGYDFECTICNQRFNSRRLERMHRMHIHREARILSLDHFREPTAGNLSPPDSDDPGDEVTTDKCHVCNIVFSNKKRFIDHTIYYMTTETIHCKTCGETFKGQYQAHYHNKTVHYSEDTQKAYTHHCDVCKEGFMYRTHLEAHMSHVHMNEEIDANADKNNADTDFNGSNACSVCDVTFPTPELVAAHKSDFVDDGEYLCNRCSKKCRTPAALLDHLTLNHSNNTVQGGVKCRRCNENFLTPSAWVSHVKHIHSPSEPSEFYLEKNVASSHKSGDIRYELIPTNDSISSGVAYFKVKNSINFPTTADNIISSVAPGRKINDVIPAQETLLVNSFKETVKTRFNHNKRITEIENVEKDEVLIVRNGDKTSKDDDEQEVNSNADKNKAKTEIPANSVSAKLSQLSKVSTDCNCPICGYDGRDPVYLATHLSLYSDSGLHMCETCGRRFEVYEFYRDHKLTHINCNKYDFACTSCNEGFRTSRELRVHLVHIHPNMPPEMLSRVNGRDPVLEPSSLLLTSVEQSETPARTDFQKQCNQIEKEHSQGERSSSEVEAATSPCLHTEIFEDEISMIYECPDCHEKYSSVERLNKHMLAVHKIHHAKNELRTSSEVIGIPHSCDVCNMVFTNKFLWSNHREKCHSIKSLKVVKSPVPVLEITVPNKRPNDPNNDKPVVIGRLYKLQDINAVPKPVDDDENNKKKFSVTRIVDENNKLQKALPKSTVKIKANVAVRLKPPIPTAVPAIPTASNANHLKSLLTPGSLFKSPVATAGKPNLTLIRLKSADKNALRLVKPFAHATEQPKSAAANGGKQPESVVQNLPPLASLSGKIVPLKTPIGRVVPLQLPVGKFVKLNPPVKKVIPLNQPAEKAVPLKPLAEKAVPLKPLAEKAVLLKPLAEKAVPLKPLARKVVPVNQLARKVVPVNQLARKVVPFNLPAKKVVPLNPVAEKVVPLNPLAKKVVPLNPPAKKVVPLTPQVGKVKQPTSSSDRQNILRTLNMGQVKFLKLDQSNTPNTEERKTITVEENATPFIITSVYSEKASVPEPITLSDSQLVTSAPPTLIKPVQIIKVESCDDRTSAISKTPDNTSANQADREMANTNSDVPSTGKSSTDDTSTKSSINQLLQLVSSLPIQPDVGSDTEDQISFSLDFESVLIPVSDDDFGYTVDESPNSAELTGPVDESKTLMIDPLNKPSEKDLPADKNKPAISKVRPPPKTANSSIKGSNRKRKGTKLIDKPATKCRKGVFDPVAYKELCRQHNLIPDEEIYQSTTS